MKGYPLENPTTAEHIGVDGTSQGRSVGIHLFTTEPLHEKETEGLVIEVTVEVEEIDLDGSLLPPKVGLVPILQAPS